MYEVRCTHCGKLLMKSIHQYEACKDCADIEIKCTKCKEVNLFKINSETHEVHNSTVMC